MAYIKLRMGKESRPLSEAEKSARILEVRDTVRQYLPELVNAVKQDVDVITMHQDAFAAGYHIDEFTLLGIAVKFVGLYRKAIMIIGRNGETFLDKPDTLGRLPK